MYENIASKHLQQAYRTGKTPAVRKIAFGGCRSVYGRAGYLQGEESPRRVHNRTRLLRRLKPIHHSRQQQVL